MTVVVGDVVVPVAGGVLLFVFTESYISITGLLWGFRFAALFIKLVVGAVAVLLRLGVLVFEHRWVG